MKLYAKGKVLGVAVRQQVNNKTGESWDKLYLVIQTPKHGGLDGQMDDAEYMLTKNQIDGGAQKRLNDLKGQEVLVEVFMNKRTHNGAVYIDWYVSGDAVPTRVAPQTRSAA